jgi:hypothetical protein
MTASSNQSVSRRCFDKSSLCKGEFGIEKGLCILPEFSLLNLAKRNVYFCTFKAKIG